MKQALRALALVGIVTLTTACSSGPDSEQVEEALKLYANANGSPLPTDAFTVEEITIIEEKNENNLYSTQANVDITLTKDGNDINMSWLGLGGIQGGLAASAFTRSGGFMLKKGQMYSYVATVTFIKKDDGTYALIDR